MLKLSDKVYDVGLKESIEKLENRIVELLEDSIDFATLMQYTAQYGEWLCEMSVVDKANVALFIETVFGNISECSEKRAEVLNVALCNFMNTTPIGGDLPAEMPPF